MMSTDLDAAAVEAHQLPILSNSQRHLVQHAGGSCETLISEKHIAEPVVSVENNGDDKKGKTRTGGLPAGVSQTATLRDFAIDNDNQNLQTTSAINNNGPLYIISRLWGYISKFRKLHSERERPVDTEEAAQATTSQAPASNPCQVAQDNSPTLVVFEEGALDNPLNWSIAGKRTITAVAFYCYVVVGFNTSVVTTDIAGIAGALQISETAALVVFSIFVVGFTTASVVFSPLSETYGRRKVYLCTLLPAVISTIPCALSANYPMLVTFRFVSGVLFGAPITLCGATISDIWMKSNRGLYLNYFTSAPLLGLIVGPLIGGFLAERWHWRSLFWAQGVASSIAALLMLVVPETYACKILRDRSDFLNSRSSSRRFMTAYHGANPGSLKDQLIKQLTTPIKMLIRERILTLMSLYVGVMFGQTYILFVSLPQIYMDGFGYNRSQTGLCFIPAGLGVFCGVLPSHLLNNKYRSSCERYDKQRRESIDLELQQQQQDAPPDAQPDTSAAPSISASSSSTDSHQHYPPELRLMPMLVFSPLIVVALFLLGFTPAPNAALLHLPFMTPEAFPSQRLIVPFFALFIFGFAIVIVLNAANSYVTDCYSKNVACAFAGVTIVRGTLASVCILFTPVMYQGLGIRNATWVLAAVALVGSGVPYWFRYQGKAIRARSPWCWKEDC